MFATKSLKLAIFILLLAVLAIFSGCGGGGGTVPSINHSPTIVSLTADPLSPIEVNQSTTITCYASDQDNDQLTYTWTKTGGTIIGSGSTITWTAPSTEGTYTITCTVSDGNGGEDSETLNIVVDEPSPVSVSNKIFLESGGNLNGTSIDPSNPVLTVSTGESITGTVNVQAIYSGTSGNIVPFGYTPSWGSHSSSYVTVKNDLPVGTTTYNASIDLNAPSTSGTYFLIFASNCEMNLGWTMSRTNWTTGSYSWNDGKDIADLIESNLDDSLSTGYLSLDMLVGSSYQTSSYGIAYVKIIVTEGDSIVSSGSVHNLTKDTYYDTIQAALDDADSNNTIEVSDGTYDESITFPYGKKIILQSANGASSTIIWGNANSPTVHFDGSLTGTTLEGFTITHASTNEGRGIYINEGYVIINDCTISGNNSNGNGGGIYNNGNTTINRSTISNNTADTINVNTGCFGGGLLNGDTLTINGSTISNNISDAGGGGILNWQDSTLTIIDSTISYNYASDFCGGGIWNYSGGNLAITGSIISDNYVYGFAAGICTSIDTGIINIGGDSEEEKNTICGNYKSGYNPSLDQQIRSGSESLYEIYKDNNYISAYCGGETYTLTTSVSPSGSGSVSLSPSGGTYAAGTVVTLTANPATDYRFDYWGGDATGTSNPTTITMNSHKNVIAYFVYDPDSVYYTLTTSVSPSGSGSVSLSPSGGTYAAGTVVTLTANPATDYRFDYWGGDATGTSNPTTITMNSHKNVIAYFVYDPDSVYYTLTTSVSPSGSGSVSLSPSGGTYAAGTVVTLTANPATDYRFDYWGGDATGTSNPTTITMNSHKNVIAYFVYDPDSVYYTLTTSVSPSGSGSVSPSGGTYTSGTSVTLTATPATNYKFDHWGGSITGTSNPTTITMSSNKTVSAYFVPIQYNLTTSVSPSGSGTVTLNPSGGTYAPGTVVTLATHANTGYKFDHWGGDAGGTNTSTTVTMDRSKSVTAYFVPIQYYTLTTSATPSSYGYVTLDPSGGSYAAGTVVTLTAHTNSSIYKLDYWSGDASGSSNPVQVTMDSNKSVTAHFRLKHYSLTTSVSPSGSGTVNPSGGTYDTGTVVTLTADANTYYKFDHWGGDAGGTSTSTTITMDGNKNVIAYFVPIQYTLTTIATPSSYGYVNPSTTGGSYDAGTVVTISAFPYTGYKLDHWSGDASGSSNPVYITMDRNKIVTANFVPKQYTLTTSVSPSGSGYVTLSPSGGAYNPGTSVTLTAHEYSKYEFCYWDTGTACIDQNPVTITMNEDKTMTAVYRQYRLLGVGLSVYPDPDDDLPWGAPSANCISWLYSHHKYDFAFNNCLINSEATLTNFTNTIINQIQNQAKPQDITYFYFSGHGGIKPDGVSYINLYGYSMTVDLLASRLERIPGTVVVLLDTCNSGGFIGKGGHVNSTYTKDFNEGVLNVFSSEVLSRDNLCQSKFKVLTSCRSDQLSIADPPVIGEIGMFTNHYLAGCGYETFSYPCPANIDSDPAVSLHEAYNYVKDNVSNWMPFVDQDVQIYPYGSNFIVMEY